MNRILIKECSRPGVDAKLFRAYKDDQSLPSPHTTLKVSASCTNSAVIGALRCAAKAFAKYTEPGCDPIEIESRIKLTEDPNNDGLWVAELQPKMPNAGTERRTATVDASRDSGTECAQGRPLQ